MRTIADRLIANLNLAATGPNHRRELAVFKWSFGARNAVAVVGFSMGGIATE